MKSSISLLSILIFPYTLSTKDVLPLVGIFNLIVKDCPAFNKDFCSSKDVFLYVFGTRNSPPSFFALSRASSNSSFVRKHL